MEKVLINGALEESICSLERGYSGESEQHYGERLWDDDDVYLYCHVPCPGGDGREETRPFLYTWNDGRASPSGSVTVPPGGLRAPATFTFTATGRVGPAYAFPGVAEVDVTSPDVVKSNQVIPTGACTP